MDRAAPLQPLVIGTSIKLMGSCTPLLKLSLPPFRGTLTPTWILVLQNIESTPWVDYNGKNYV
jgi:hypothetical protein